MLYCIQNWLISGVGGLYSPKRQGYQNTYSRTSLIRPSMIRISGLTDPKPCLPTFSLKEWSTMSDNTAFYTFSETINSSAL